MSKPQPQAGHRLKRRSCEVKKFRLVLRDKYCHLPKERDREVGFRATESDKSTLPSLRKAELMRRALYASLLTSAIECIHAYQLLSFTQFLLFKHSKSPHLSDPGGTAVVRVAYRTTLPRITVYSTYNHDQHHPHVYMPWPLACTSAHNHIPEKLMFRKGGISR